MKLNLSGKSLVNDGINQMEFIDITNKRIKIILTIIIISISLIFIFPVSSCILNSQNNNEQKGFQSELTRRIKETLGVWATIKVTSAVISTLETIQLEAGVSIGAQLSGSVNPAAGLAVADNILDQTSSILLWSVGALSIMKILLTVSIWISLKIIVPICCFLIIFILWNKKYQEKLKRIITGLIIICIGISTAVPLAMQMSNVVKNNILANQIQNTTEEINSLGAHIENEGNEVNNPSFFNTIIKNINNISNFIKSIKEYVDRLVENIINYIMIFIVVNIIIPIITIIGLKVLIGAILHYIGFTVPNFNFLNRSKQKKEIV